jgi:exopolyphosphatase/guanosine-5'-triphosphate,3'-diphosphate pyrophosphatase
MPRRPTSSSPSAVIDIGTNSVKLLVAFADHRGVRRTIAFRRETTRLGAGLARTGRIAEPALRATVECVDRFRRIARRHGAVEVVAIGTLALRKASNAAAALARIERGAGVEVRVLSGREEARLAWLSASASVRRPRGSMLILDVGGGSTELVFARRGEILVARSLPLGALHLTERFLRADPIDPSEHTRLENHTLRALERVFDHLPLTAPGDLDLVASGGAITTISALLAPRRAGTTHAPVALGKLRALQATCLALTLTQRKRLPNMPADRADIMPAGIAVVIAVMGLARKRVLTVNVGGVREGVLIDAARAKHR